MIARLLDSEGQSVWCLEKKNRAEEYHRSSQRIKRNRKKGREKMGYWKSKVLPTIKKMFEKKPGKKAAAAEAIKNFDESKEAINKEMEEKKTELQPKVMETYEATSAEVKALVREPKEDGLKKHSTDVQKFLEELVKIEFPGSKAVSEASANFGVSYLTGPVSFVFEKVSEFLPPVEKTRDVASEEVTTEEETKTSEETSGDKEKETVGEKKEEAKPAEEEEKKKEETAPVEAPAKTPAKEEETPASEPSKA
ncbi:PREDICTED: plasma membrane-associated cation-binding protein 1-like [Tarenaya hassleriana]|uniref:plasma membrane-associated cation-binding protein 1-like n=1 Tax=Tarenaya hassleriana TaxID=28532 RepID=UPI00053C619A|nr:PREDICTED: plasma membrane-associated cation-binding protein 1-like [Tarenaya hassleriana]